MWKLLLFVNLLELFLQVTMYLNMEYWEIMVHNNLKLAPFDIFFSSSISGKPWGCIIRNNMSSKQKRKIRLFFFFQKSIKFSRVSKLKPFILPCICDLPSPSPFNHAISSFHLKYHCFWSWLVNYFSLKMLSVKLLPGDSISVSDRKKKEIEYQSHAREETLSI